MKRQTREDEIDGGGRIITQELDFMTSTDLLPELMAVVGPGYGVMSGDAAAIGDGLARMAIALCGGKLVRLLPVLLKGTIVVAPDDETDKLTKYDLSEAGAINRAFTGKGRKKIAILAAKAALELNFYDFFDGLDLAGLATRKPSS